MRFPLLRRFLFAVAAVLPVALILSCAHVRQPGANPVEAGTGVEVRQAFARDVSAPLASMDAVPSMKDSPDSDDDDADVPSDRPPALAPRFAAAGIRVKTASTVASNAAARFIIPRAAIAVEQTKHGTRPPPEILASFDGLGEGFTGPQGRARLSNPSDNTLAV